MTEGYVFWKLCRFVHEHNFACRLLAASPSTNGSTSNGCHSNPPPSLCRMFQASIPLHAHHTLSNTLNLHPLTNLWISLNAYIYCINLNRHRRVTILSFPLLSTNKNPRKFRAQRHGITSSCAKAPNIIRAYTCQDQKTDHSAGPLQRTLHG